MLVGIVKTVMMTVNNVTALLLVIVRPVDKDNGMIMVLVGHVFQNV